MPNSCLYKGQGNKNTLKISPTILAISKQYSTPSAKVHYSYSILDGEKFLVKISFHKGLIETG